MAKRVLVGVVQLRRHYGQIMAAVEAGEHRILARRSSADFALVSMDWYRKAQQALAEPAPKWQAAGVEKLRSGMKGLLDAVAAGQHVIVMRYSEQVAAVVPIKWYRDACTAMGDPTEF